MNQERRKWVGMLCRVAEPVLKAMAKRELRATMPVEQHPDARQREKVMYLEALGRTLAGIGPWLQLREGGDEEENAARRRMFEWAIEAVDAGTEPGSPDRLNFTEGGQPLVDAAFLARGLLRCPRLWAALSDVTRRRLAADLKSTRAISPGFNNWLLFSAEIEAMLHRADEPFDRMRVDYALRQHEQWYVGDGMYSDGPWFHQDYYNSFVIQPMLLDVLDELRREDQAWEAMHDAVLRRARRYAAALERMIAPDGSFPAIGRSICYRCGAFGLPAQLAWQHRLPDELKPAQMRGALGAVMERTLGAAETFDAKGFLRIGLAGHQPGLGEVYISTGSLYLAAEVFAPLGLPDDDAFWVDEPAAWTSVKIWGGDDAQADHALHDEGR